MAGPLQNARHERFAQELAKGASQVEAYRAAGYAAHESSASRLLTNAKISARVDELKAAAAERAIVTIYDIADQLDEDRTFAREQEAPAAAITATMGKAKVLGLIPDRIEHTGKDGGPIQTEDVSLPEAARRIAFTLSAADRPKPATLN